MPPTVSEFAGDLDGFLYRGPCNGSGAADECITTGCMGGMPDQGGKVDLKTEFTLGGDPDTTYEIELHVYGVVELHKEYSGGVRRKGNASNTESMKDFWYEGGSAADGYNVYALRVTPAVDGVENAATGGNNYFLNARDGSGNGHEVWELNYDATILANGGSKVEFRAYDPNCIQIQNVGMSARPMAGTGPGGALMIDLGEADPAPPGDFAQPLTAGDGNGQWIYVDVTSVTAVE
jgi:hypothetical protein